VPRPEWTTDDIGDQTGRVALVTGANSGIGFATARALADRGAHVVMACRNPEKARRAADEMESDLDRSSIEILTLDLSDLVSVRRAAEQFLAGHARLDLLINNAGVMGTPYRQTPDGFELQMATNHLGHFALTGLLLTRLVTTDRARVVTVSSVMHRAGHIDFDDIAGVKIGNTWAHYGRSKLANLLFTAELSRRLQEAGESVTAVAAHPGWTRSNLIGNGAALGSGRVRAKASRVFGTLLGQTAAAGARPTLYAATSPDVRSGQFIGPAHVAQLFGPPKVVQPNRRARNSVDAARLWEISEELTGVDYRFPAPV
jgi:NAD(P)-dependent dehydrogenase (short-subunit alcohol dehydrogenase family)